MQVLQHNTIMAFEYDHDDIVNTDKMGLPMAARPGHEVRSYRTLLEKVASLRYHNPRFKILFRGQGKDYNHNAAGNEGLHSSLYPSILRSERGKGKDAELLNERFHRLAAMEEMLIKALGVKDIYRNQIVRWAILQHYEICDTPLIDLTQSLQTALSFALKNHKTEGFVYALAFPQVTGPVSVSIESMTQVVDLSQLCPPEALRPHFQEGMLAGDYPIIDRREASHGGKGMIGNNFACRLLTKFKVLDCGDWHHEGFTPTPDKILFPNSDDSWFKLLKATLESGALC